MASATDVNEVNIAGINKGFLLLKLVHGTKIPATIYRSVEREVDFLRIFLQGDFYRDACRAASEGKVDYYLGWFPIKTDLRGDTVNPRMYDRDARAGSGTFKSIVDEIRATFPIPLYPSRAEIDKLSLKNLDCFDRLKGPAFEYLQHLSCEEEAQ
jgi:hypothetical protein